MLNDVYNNFDELQDFLYSQINISGNSEQQLETMMIIAFFLIQVVLIIPLIIFFVKLNRTRK